MNARFANLLALAAAVCVLSVGVAYAALRPVSWTSEASIVLAPQAPEADDLPSLLDSFERSGTVGTYVELIASHDTLRRAGSPPVAVTVRAIPDTRVITISTTGERDEVQPALRSVLLAATAAQAGLRDLWKLSVLESPSGPGEAGPSASLVIAASALLAILAAVATGVAVRRIAVGEPGRLSGEAAPARQ
jgi:uncharacterized protein involved in exopolysaccharide biosynthesis